MKIIVGLGNPGEKYQNNRHNVGLLLADYLQRSTLPSGLIVKKSSEFMNGSGIFVKKIVAQYKLNISDLWIIHDDLDISLGSYKIQQGKGPKLHNGILSIEQELRSTDFWRIRIGVENRQQTVAGKEYVLDNFTDEEITVIKNVFRQIKDDLLKRIPHE